MHSYKQGSKVIESNNCLVAKKHYKEIGCSPNKSHGAEVDCWALMRITAVLGNDWLDWAQQSCTQFDKCEVMWSMPRESNI